MLRIFVTELIGSLIISLLGNGVMCATILNQRGNKESNSFLVISIGWALAITIGINTSLVLGGSAHLNSVITIMYFIIDGIQNQGISVLFIFLFSQILGFIIGQILIYLFYFEIFKIAQKKGDLTTIFACFTAINANNYRKRSLYIAEFVSCAFFLFSVFMTTNLSHNIIDSKNAYIFTFFVILAISLSFGKITGPCISPTRDLALRTLYCLLFWKYSNKKEIYLNSLPYIISPIFASIFVGYIIKILM